MTREDKPDLRTVKAIVTDILWGDEQARNSDNYLYLQVLLHFARKQHINLDMMSVCHFFINLKEYPFPSFETVRRSRQKVQEQNPDLAACKKVKEFREDKEQTFRDFARC